MVILMKKLRSVVGNILKKSNLTNSRTNWKQNKMKMKMKIRRKEVSPVPAGCFPVYVGPEENNKQRFVVKVEMASHPLFQILLEDAESKYGMNRQGPISLPCDVDLFYKVLAEMDMDIEDGIEDDAPVAASWNFIVLGRYGLKTLLVVDGKKMDNNNNSYGLLNQSS